MTDHLLIFGATRNTGLHIAKQAIATGLQVSAMVREKSNYTELEQLGVTLIKGDAFSLEDCEHAVYLSQPTLIVSVLGGKTNGRRVDAEGNIHVIQAAQNHALQLQRFVLLTSQGCGEDFALLSEQAKAALGEALKAKDQAESLLQQSALPWTIVRPGGLNHDAATHCYSLLDKVNRQLAGYLPRADVAAAVLAILHDSHWLKRVAYIYPKAD